jgi:type II secretory pathway pseudopilin PulG
MIENPWPTLPKTLFEQRWFSLMELILAMFILAGAATTLLVERQRSIQHRQQVMEKREALQQLQSALDHAEVSIARNVDVLTEPPEELSLSMETQTVDGLNVDLTLVRATWTTGTQQEFHLERWVQP